LGPIREIYRAAGTFGTAAIYRSDSGIGAARKVNFSSIGGMHRVGERSGGGGGDSAFPSDAITVAGHSSAAAVIQPEAGASPGRFFRFPIYPANLAN